ncbi:PREDICTED: neuron-specific protein family member 2 isoform X2 [Colobus angolensis palliatus]|uniref:neuron-specific protein family member 2 isoform X2 n=1 Tax=Colobus angolensis palliatus TaxID=336983 RepID=UPI0005F42210|nr:PREDICTED: neuron-specific protein family member 2 isoform X2 [Colobus angolensis palliatus]XP_011803210.1 PREDICTED: neuron-specific protein family member 2 isoform X2 [Colobus angolensis palliatus]XP_011803211.1 PREDICTED: neuron-specific protein family member 2 isoform X2 [Colobus angolensis palliatus]
MTTAAQRDSSISTNAVSQPPWMRTTPPRTPIPEAASTQSSATTVWPSRALPGPSGRGCRQPLSSMSPSRPRPRATRGLPQPEWGAGWRGGPPLAKPSSSYKTTLYSWDMGAGAGQGRVGGGAHRKHGVCWSCLNRYFFSFLGIVDSSPSQAHVQRHVSC